MVIKPRGYAIWEAIQRDLDRRFKDTGHVNAYFPLLIPQSLPHERGRARRRLRQECAIVTHSKLQKGPDGKLVPAGELEEPLIVRPTSETIIGAHVRPVDPVLPRPALLINQWCNVVRWEMRTRLFLRTTEFLWQEGHTAHDTDERGPSRNLRMLDVYADFAEKFLAMPVIKGAKTDARKIPRRRHHLLHRGHDAGRQGPPGRHVPLPRPELRQGLRHQIPRPRPEARPLLDHLLGPLHAHDRRDHHGPQR